MGVFEGRGLSGHWQNIPAAAPRALPLPNHGKLSPLGGKEPQTPKCPVVFCDSREPGEAKCTEFVKALLCT